MSRPSRAGASCRVLEADSLAPHAPQALLAPLRGPGCQGRGSELEPGAACKGAAGQRQEKGNLGGPGLGLLSLAPVGLVSLTPTPEGLLAQTGRRVQGGEGTPSPLSWALSFTSPPSLFFITQHGKVVKRQPPSSVPGKVLWAGWGGGPLPRPPDLPPERTW